MRHRGQHGSDCFGCKVKTVQLGSGTTPTRSRSSAPPKVDDNSNAWERGHVYDRPGMPYLDKHLEPIGTKEWVNKRHVFEEARDKLNHERSQAQRS